MFKLSLQLQKAAQHLRGTTLNVTAVLATLVLLVVPRALAATTATNSCQLKSPKGAIQHVIYVQFDNTHFRRDNPDVPSDLEQMPHLLNFIQDNGVLMSNDHTVLISHTATGILTSLTGVYPDRMGQPVSNSFRYFTPSGTTRTGVSFAYWTAPLFDPAPGPPFPPAAQTDLTPEMINENGKIAPAPWVPYTRAGFDVGQVGTANTVLENTGIDVPNGYTGYNGLFGAKYVDPIIKPSGPMTDLDGNTIQDQNHHVGFPGFDGMTATVSLSWIAQMQEAGVPITYGYISDAHDGHGTSGNIHFAYGPGEAGYVQQLKDYDSAFEKFFNRLADDAPNVYITGNPSQTDPATRKLEREMAQLSWLNPYTNQTEQNIMVALV